MRGGLLPTRLVWVDWIAVVKREVWVELGLALWSEGMAAHGACLRGLWDLGNPPIAVLPAPY